MRSETQYDKNGKIAGFGHWVEVACIDGTRRRYGHLKTEGVPVGTVLRQGDAIGVMGNSGTSGGLHLHYEWRNANGQLMEPEINGKTYHNNDKSYVRTAVAGSSTRQGSELASLADPSQHPKLPAGDGKPTALAFNQAHVKIGAVRG
ncbi:MAG: hypothetical protein B7X02_02630 [Rhodospirillales bacterium 12-54-5]|nr:MAG: hypothetical protein B7X02_02630 [Rhodospirillales bacterium 12-54-5]